MSMNIGQNTSQIFPWVQKKYTLLKMPWIMKVLKVHNPRHWKEKIETNKTG